jgi:hypothetical protein
MMYNGLNRMEIIQYYEFTVNLFRKNDGIRV